MPEWMALLPTDLEAVGPYRLEGRLGTGGQGTVYVGGEKPGQRVAIKLLHPHLVTDERARTRFLSEVEIAKRVAPYCTAQVLDSGVANEQPYIVSEFVDGPSLQESVRSTGPRGGAALERLAFNTVTALAAIHQADVVHRDLKPGNILLGPDGPVVIDFGIALALDLSRSIITSQVVGSPGYMAPEQISGDAVGPAADLFAWGATMVFAATGQRAFSGESIPAVMQAILHGEPNLEALDGRLGAVIRACLDKDPARRPTAEQVGNDLRALPGPAWNTADAPVAALQTEPASEAGATSEDEPASAKAPEDTSEDEPAQPPEAGRGDETAPADGAKRRRLAGVGAAVLVLLAALGLAYSVISPDKGRSGSLRTPGSAGPSGGPSGSPPASPGPSGSKGDASRAPSAGTPATPAAGAGRQSPGRPDGAPNTGGSKAPATKKPSSRPSGGGQPSSDPKVIGTVSISDMNGYCRSKGYAGSGGPWNSWCYGPGGEQVSMTSVCRWAYPGHPNVKADGTTCKEY
ncbi:serine/threonine protein kinase [Actinomadura xylanilytica]|uniref:serine/threonine protein kinase n=1 Tax=Actinomadura xylanilytica TaxID=887459 RepID=UPI00255B243F|nr:serine/threonine-protein kinase [Actinomadura xylanilytica]MDL4773861.1 protein kinase [Actinomadura xylanilytica]